MSNLCTYRYVVDIGLKFEMNTENSLFSSLHLLHVLLLLSSFSFPLRSFSFLLLVPSLFFFVIAFGRFNTFMKACKGLAT